MEKAARILIAFVTAVIAATLLGSVLQTQINLVAMHDIAPPINFSIRVENSLYDIVHFGPLFGLIVLCTFVGAIAAAELLAHLTKSYRMLWLVAGCAIGLFVAFKVVDLIAPVPTFIAATRTLGGTLVMLLSALAGGLIYAAMTRSVKEN